MIRTQIVLSLYILLMAASASGTIWDGGGIDNSLGTAKNWDGNSAPKNDGSQTLSFQGSTRISPVAGQTWLVMGIHFSNTSSAFKLTGGQLNVGDLGIRSLVAKAQTISNPIRLTANQPWWASQGDLVLNGAVDLDLKTVTLQGPGNMIINGNVSPGFIDVRNNCTLTLSGLVS